jgi:REP element-mobilizing transposase RayT
MPRQLRLQYPGAMYHLMSRGDRREKIFLDDVDRHDFIKTLAEACQKTGWQVHAYCLMPNHYHVVLETPEANLVAGMAWLQSTYTIRLNHRHKLFGHVFSGRYRAQLVEGSGNGYLKTACDYVHMNPVRARMLAVGERLLSYPWSSYGAYLAAAEHRPRWIRVDRLLGEHGIQEDTPQGREQFEAAMERRRAEESDPEALKALRRGWCLGSGAFKREMLARMEGNLGEHHAGELHGEAVVAKAARHSGLTRMADPGAPLNFTLVQTTIPEPLAGYGVQAVKAFAHIAGSTATNIFRLPEKDSMAFPECGPEWRPAQLGLRC